jgi:hypothetical protein
MSENMKYLAFWDWLISLTFENCLFNSFAQLLIVLFILLVFNFLSYLYITDLSPFSNEQLAKIFSSSVTCLLVLVIVSFDEQKLFNLMQSIC